MKPTQDAIDKLATKFIFLVQRAIDDTANLAEIDRLNGENRGGCATHDFLDANATMADAFIEAFEREAVREAEAGTPAAEQAAFDQTLWNRAWTRARSLGFTPITWL